ncbi:hypothetical protein Sru01_03770 [Sphaerisporangium rufum]|uniref:histidine kinase n=1 Tax=Sphaerisporangium rufum TaxID=1381558 RepID=A0A919R1N0_9ACTN|nr:histidine kinase [Sphaerisporangium rufum]GII75395.1 hypothetical protein Sru01_03770 [Sphaerisporangium rufum]
MRRSLAADGAVTLAALGLTLVMLAGGGFGDTTPGARPLDVPGVLLAAATALPLLARRRAPFTVYGVVAVAGLLLDAFGYPYDVPFGPVIAAYGLAVTWSGHPRRSRRLAALLAILAFAPATAVAYALSEHRLQGITPELVFFALLTGGLWLAGDRARLRREQLAVLEERATRTEREAERERRLAAAEERIRIARELHDSAGHAINVILVQAGAARLLHERDPEGSRRAIATVEKVARGTIGEIDRLVRALREDDGSAQFEPADPAALEELVRRHRAGGLRISTDLRGPRAALPRSVAWAAYRILQEALTNAARHGGEGRVDVAVRFDPDAVEITVTNPVGPGGTRPGTGGHGIIGMRERATLLGGVLDVTTTGRTFRLHARLPCGREAT